MPETAFQAGDRVQRHVDVYDHRSRLRHGAVVCVYGKRSERFGIYPELYDVQWDDGRVEHGFLPHGLSREGSHAR
jgi:hypothetical protein